MGRISRRRFIEGTALALGGNLTHSFDGLFGDGAALAQGTGESTWPSRPVRFIVPLAAGGGLDFVARVISEAWATGEQMRQNSRSLQLKPHRGGSARTGS